MDLEEFMKNPEIEVHCGDRWLWWNEDGWVVRENYFCGLSGWQQNRVFYEGDSLTEALRILKEGE